MSLLKHTNRLVKRWMKHPRHIVVNTLDGKDRKTGHFVRVLMVQEYPPEIIAGYLDQLDGVVTHAGATLRKTIRYAQSDIKFNTRMKYKLNRLTASINDQSETDPARNAEIAAKETILALRDSTLSNDHKLVEVQTFLTLSAPKLHQIEAAEAGLKLWFDNMSGKLNELKREQRSDAANRTCLRSLRES